MDNINRNLWRQQFAHGSFFSVRHVLISHPQGAVRQQTDCVEHALMLGQSKRDRFEFAERFAESGSLFNIFDGFIYCRLSAADSAKPEQNSGKIHAGHNFPETITFISNKFFHRNLNIIKKNRSPFNGLAAGIFVSLNFYSVKIHWNHNSADSTGSGSWICFCEYNHCFCFSYQADAGFFTI